MKNTMILSETIPTSIVGKWGESFVQAILLGKGYQAEIWRNRTIDVFAFRGSLRLGFSVKARRRSLMDEEESINLFESPENRRKFEEVCFLQNCVPWIACVVSFELGGTEVFLMPLSYYDEKYRGKTGRKIDDLKMGLKYRRAYPSDPNVIWGRIPIDWLKRGELL